MTPRAKPLAAAQRREALINATLPLLLEHGRGTTTRQIADACGVAEGTIFRVFESKHELFQAAVLHATDFGPFLADLRTIDPDQGLRGVLLDISARLQMRFRGVFALMTRMGMVQPPQTLRQNEDQRHEAGQIMVALVAPYADELDCEPRHLVHLLRLLTFSGTHPHISDGQLLTPEQIVDALLDGLRTKD